MDSTLYDAVVKDDINVLKVIKGTLNVSYQRTPTNDTVLHLACQYGSLKCVEDMILSVPESLLLEINSSGETALHLAAREGHCKVVVALINAAKSYHLQPDNPQDTSSTVLQNLIRTPNVELETALHAAVRYNHKYVVELLVTADPSCSYSQNKCDETPLYLASVRRYTDVIKTILDNCIYPTFGGPYGRTALHAAVLDNGGRECLKLLLDKNKHLLRAADMHGWTVFHYVAYYNLDTLVDDLASADKSLAYLVDKKYKRTALHVAAHQGNVRVMKEIIKHFPDSLGMLDARGENVFHIAAEKRQKEVIKLILSRGYKASSNLLIQREKKEGNTPLHFIAKCGCYVKELMDLTTLDWEVVNYSNKTPLDLLHVFDIKADHLLQEFYIEQVMIQITLIKAKVKRHQYLQIVQEEPDVEIREQITKLNSALFYEFNKWLSTHMILAALIATVALTAGFAMPGGFDGNQGLTQGSPLLLRKTSFQTFIVTDAIALLSSISSLFLYFTTTAERHGQIIGNLVSISTVLNIVSVVAIMLAFMTGTCAVLAHSSALAISVAVITSFFFLLVLSILAYLIWFYWRIYLFFTILTLQGLKEDLIELTSAITRSCRKYLKSMRTTLAKYTGNKSQSIL